MRNFFLSLFVLLASLQLSGQKMFRNPVNMAHCADPTIFRGDSNGRYICFSTEHHTKKNYMVSTDLVNWKDSGKKLISSTGYADLCTIYRHRWAPQYAFIGGRHLLYLSAVHAEPSGKGQGIAVFSADAAEGPYHFEAMITESRETGIEDSIDPFVVEDEGKVWMAFGSTGGVHIVELAADGLSLAPGAKYKHIAGVEVIYDRSRKRCYEGSYLYKRGGWWYLFLSAGYYANASYYLLVGRSKKITGPYKDRNGVNLIEGQAPALLSTEPGNELMYGPGHNGEIFTDKTGQDYMFYHCHHRQSPNMEDKRRLFLQRLFWDEKGWPYFETGHPLAQDVAPQL